MRNFGLWSPVNQQIPEEKSLTYKDSVEASIDAFPVVQFLVDMLLNTNTASVYGFLPVNLLLVSLEIAPDAWYLTVSLMIVPMSRSMFKSRTLNNFAGLMWWSSG